MSSSSEFLEELKHYVTLKLYYSFRTFLLTFYNYQVRSIDLNNLKKQVFIVFIVFQKVFKIIQSSV